MIEGERIAVVTDYASLIEAIRTRLDQLGTSHLEFDRSAGLADGHTDKILCGTKNLGPTSLTTIMAGAAVMLVMIEDPNMIEMARKRLKKREASLRMRAEGKHGFITLKFSRRKLRKMALNGGIARSKKLSKTQLRMSARKAARARWSKHKQKASVDEGV
jgi:hypothetical protein